MAKDKKKNKAEPAKPPKVSPAANAITAMPPRNMIDKPAKWQGVRIPGGQKMIELAVDYRWGDVVRDPDVALKFDNDIYDRIELFTDAAAAMDYMRKTVSGHGHSFITKDRKYEELIPYFEEFFENIDRFHEAKQLLCYAIFRGVHASRIVSEVRHDYQLVADDQERSWWMITSLEDRDKRGMYIEHTRSNPNEPDSADNRIYYWIFQDPVTLSWEAKNPNKYVIWEFNKTFRSAGYGEGLVWKAWPDIYRGTQLTDIYDNSYDLYGTGIKIGKIDSTLGYGNDAGTNAPTPQQRKDELYDVLAYLPRTNYTVVIDKEDEVNFEWPNPGMFESLRMELERIGSKLWMLFVGHDIFRQKSGGSRAQSATQLRAGDRNIITLRTSLDAIIQEQLMQRFWELNQVNWEDMGLWTPKCPIKYQTNRFLDRELDDEVKALEFMRDSKQPIYGRELYDRLGYSMPEITKENLDEIIDWKDLDPIEHEKQVDEAQGNDTDILDDESDLTDQDAIESQDTEAPDKEE